MAAYLCSSTAASAQIFVGGFGAPSDPDHVRVFASASGGDVPPVRLLGGLATQLESPSDFVLAETEGGRIYVADFMGQAIHVFAPDAQGNTAPLRTIRSVLLGQPRDIEVVNSPSEVLAIASLCCLAAYDRSANGDVAALRYLGGPTTELDNPSGLAYRAATDEVYLGDYNGSGGEILVFPRTAAGGAAPSRKITGPDTQLGNWIVKLAAHPTLPEVYALIGDATNPEVVNRIVTFSASASGNATPLRVIGGDTTQLVNGSAFDYDARLDEFNVLVGSTSGMARLLTFPRTATGDVAPRRILSGPSTGLDNQNALMTLAPDVIFWDGFQP